MKYLNAEIIQELDITPNVKGELTQEEGVECWGLPAINMMEADLKMQYANIGTIKKTVNQPLTSPYKLLKMTYQCRGWHMLGYWQWRDTIRFYLSEITPPVPPGPPNPPEPPVTKKNWILIIVIAAIVLFIVLGGKK